MSHTPHELRAEFPEFEARIHTLKETDTHFKRLFDEYHTVNREIHRIEVGEEHVTQEASEEFRKRRMRLKDQLYAMLKS